MQALFAITHDGQTIPAYIDFSKIKTVSELIHLTNTQMLTAYEKSQYPFEECCNDLGLNIQTCFEFGRLGDWEPKRPNDQTTKRPNNQTTILIIHSNWQ